MTRVNVHDFISKPYRSGVPAMTIGEGLTKALKARDPALRSPPYGNVNANVADSVSSGLDVPLHELASSIKSFNFGISEFPISSRLQTLRSHLRYPLSKGAKFGGKHDAS